MECAAWSSFAHYRDGFLPGPGGIDDQPAPLVAAIRVFQSEWNETERYQIEQAQRKRG